MIVEHQQPGVGNWYRNKNGDSFEIVASDDDDETVELQYFDGTLEELDLDTWNELVIEPIEPPEDWSGSLDIQRTDYGVDLDRFSLSMQGSPLNQFDR